MLVVNGLICRPITFFWEGVGDGTCIAAADYYLAVAVINFAIDLLTLVLPVREVWRLHATFWRKLGLFGAFSVGSM